MTIENSTRQNCCRREFLRICGVAGGASVLSSCAPGLQAPYDKQRVRPNIVLIIADQFRGDCLGGDLLGHAVRTPHLNRLAAEGARFRRAYSSLPSCIPARTSLLTGQSPWGHGLLGYANMAEKMAVKKPRLLRRHGYYTIGIGKMHFHPARAMHGYHRIILEEAWHSSWPNAKEKCEYVSWFEKALPGKDVNASGLSYTDHRSRGFPYDEYYHPTNWTTREALEFLEQHEKDRPFFMKVS